MSESIGVQKKRLEALTVEELRERYAEVFGEPTRVKHKQYLIKRIVWKTQALREGDLSERARKRAVELAKDAEVRMLPPRVLAETDGPIVTAAFMPGSRATRLAPGTVLRRLYKGEVLVVKVLARGFEYDGEVYRSLTAIAQKVTGSHWNGVNFFGLTPKKQKHDTQDAEVRA